MNYDILLEPDEIKKLDVDDIYRKVVDGIYLNEYEWQKKNMIPFRGKNLAEYLDLFLVVCPKCNPCVPFTVTAIFSRVGIAAIR